jgi:Carbohydrate esterase, sialic acid-specific acetylesterase
MRWVVLLIVLTGCEKMKFFNIQNRTNTGPIGGTPLFIISGQSNCGRSRVSEMTGGESAIYAPSVINAYMLNAWRYFQNSVVNFEAFDAGTNTMLENRNFDDEFGPETSLAYQLENYSSKARYYIKSATGNTNLADDYAAPSGTRYLQLQEVINNGLNDGGLPSDLRLHAFIWMQGENDAIDPTDAANYQTNLQNFYDEFKDWWVNTKGKNSDFKFIVGRIQDINQGDEELIRAAQASFVSITGNNAILIDTDAYTRLDYIHFDATSQIQFGIDIFNQVKDL